MFVRYALRTTDAPAARDFYRRALGLELPDGRSEDTSLEAWPLHERAIAAEETVKLVDGVDQGRGGCT